MKKIISLLISIVMLASIFAACSKDKNKSTTVQTETKTDKTESTTTEAEEITTPEDTKNKPDTETSPDTEEKPQLPVQNKDELKQQDFEIPMASKAPTIDGKYDAEEWKYALEIVLTNENTKEVTGETPIVCQGGTFRYLWNKDGLYVCIDITDNTPTNRYDPAGCGNYNHLDGAQIAIYTDENFVEDGSGHAGKLFFFSLCPKADDGKAYIGEHFYYGDSSCGKDVPDAVIASTPTANGYIIECRIDAAALAKGQIELKENTELIMANVILDTDPSKDYPANQALFVDTAWFNAPYTSTYTLKK